MDNILWHYFKDKPGHHPPKETRKLQEIKVIK